MSGENFNIWDILGLGNSSELIMIGYLDMKEGLRKIFAPILNLFEAGDEQYAYKPSHRMVLKILSFLLSCLASVVFFLGRGEDLTYLLPVFLFGGVGFICFVIAFLGTDRAVSKIWGSRI